MTASEDVARAARLADRIPANDDPELELLRALCGGSLPMATCDRAALARQLGHRHVEVLAGSRVWLTERGREWIARACDAGVEGRWKA